MEEFKIVYMDGYNEVRDLETQNVVFSTKLPKYITKYINRTMMVDSVIDEVIDIWNNNGIAEGVDEYLLNEGKCTQEEREIITESLCNYKSKSN